jgi:hypothetical protein
MKGRQLSNLLFNTFFLARDVAQVIECLPIKCKSNPSNTKKINKKKEKNSL